MTKVSKRIPAGRYQKKYRGTICLNCGLPLDISDRYCPQCSQANCTKKLTLKDFFGEFFSNLVNYDSRLFKTISALLFRPGPITIDFINGKRVYQPVSLFTGGGIYKFPPDQF